MRVGTALARLRPDLHHSCPLVERYADGLKQMNGIIWECDTPLADWHLAAARACPLVLLQTVQPCADCIAHPFICFAIQHHRFQRGHIWLCAFVKMLKFGKERLSCLIWLNCVSCLVELFAIIGDDA